MSERYKVNTRWNGKILRCLCLFGNPACDRFKKCEVLEFIHEPYSDIKECMKERSYKKEKGKIRQVRND